MSQISEDVRTRVRASANNQCGYCQSLQRYVLGILEIEHIIPKAAGGSDEEKTFGLPVDYATAIKVRKLKEKTLKANKTSTYLTHDYRNGRAILLG